MAFSSQKQVRCEAGNSQGSWRVICTWFWDVTVLGSEGTRYPCFWQKNMFFSCIETPFVGYQRIRYFVHLVWCQKQLYSKTKYKSHARSPAIGQRHIVAVFGLKSQVHLVLSTLCSFQLFLANFEPIRGHTSVPDTYHRRLTVQWTDIPLRSHLSRQSPKRTCQGLRPNTTRIYNTRSRHILHDVRIGCCLLKWYG